MSAPELSSRYSPKEIEARWYPVWESRGFFRPASDTRPATSREQCWNQQDSGASDGGKKSGQGRYVVVIPPPNVTGILHMGHALNNGIQDILVRWHRMRGFDTLWVPGVDHAGIATQNVVEKKLAKEKKTRHHLGREAFLQEVWKWKEVHGSTITQQLRRLGASCDWSRERFTMDDGLSRAVRECFVTLYERGLIYQGNYIINWCPRCQTALSDEESAHKDIQGALYHIKYPIAGKGRAAEKIGEDHIVVATTRPETMLGDTAVAVHPSDPRYRGLAGKKVILPLLERQIPVIEDEFVDPEFGTGIVKVTPAHDPNDFEIGRRHGLEQINILNPDGTVNANGGVYKGLDRFEARKRVVADLEAQGLFVRRDSHLHAVGHCYRCDTMVEPYLSKQWFVKMKPLAEKALAAHNRGEVQFYPDRWTKVYTNWLEGIRDWCISRQIWWGHQIPVWYCGECRNTGDGERGAGNEEGCNTGNGEGGAGNGEGCKTGKGEGETGKAKGIIVSRETPSQCPDCGSKKLTQDPDVLDTWFSSWLWPFSTLGWPEKTRDLENFYPTSDLITAPEIIFFWVSRMIMAGLEFTGKVPFGRVYIHGTVRAQSGLKMSKSLGNAIDPLEVIGEIGADALRFSMIMLSAQDVYLSREKFEVGRNFTNKIWNATRFVLMNLGDFKGSRGLGVDAKTLTVTNRWMLSACERVTQEIGQKLSGFKMSEAATVLYHFVWGSFCDWYIEFIKPVLTAPGDSHEKEAAKKVLFYLLEHIMRLLHPFMPFITEEIWQTLKASSSDKDQWPQTLMHAEWPAGNAGLADPQAEKEVEVLQSVITGVRLVRSRYNIGPAVPLEVAVRPAGPAIAAQLKGYEKEILTLARVSRLEIDPDFKQNTSFVAQAFPDVNVFVSIRGVVDFAKERDGLEKKIAQTRSWIEGLEKKLADSNFAAHAPAEVIGKEKEKLEDARRLLQTHQEQLEFFRQN